MKLISLIVFRWYYFSGMKKDECLLFKQWDSDPTQKGRMCFHTSFHDDKAPPCPARQSIETRWVQSITSKKAIKMKDNFPKVCGFLPGP